MNTRTVWFCAVGAGVALAATLFYGVIGGAAAQKVTVYQTRTCGCCGKWVAHMQAAGFRVAVRHRDDLTATKREHGITPRLMSCHTAVVDGYAIEGHVPADVVRDLLRRRPAVTGLAAPGMPAGSPGMEGPIRQPYDIVAFARDGSTSVFASR
jgi:hypothetical protein